MLIVTLFMIAGNLVRRNRRQAKLRRALELAGPFPTVEATVLWVAPRETAS